MQTNFWKDFKTYFIWFENISSNFPNKRQPQNENNLFRSKPLTSNLLCQFQIQFFLSGSVHTLGAILGCFISIPSLKHLGRKGADTVVFLITPFYVNFSNHKLIGLIEGSLIRSSSSLNMVLISVCGVENCTQQCQPLKAPLSTSCPWPTCWASSWSRWPPLQSSS